MTKQEKYNRLSDDAKAFMASVGISPITDTYGNFQRFVCKNGDYLDFIDDDEQTVEDLCYQIGELIPIPESEFYQKLREHKEDVVRKMDDLLDFHNVLKFMPSEKLDWTLDYIQEEARKSPAGSVPVETLKEFGIDLIKKEDIQNNTISFRKVMDTPAFCGAAGIGFTSVPVIPNIPGLNPEFAKQKKTHAFLYTQTQYEQLKAYSEKYDERSLAGDKYGATLASLKAMAIAMGNKGQGTPSVHPLHPDTAAFFDIVAGDFDVTELSAWEQIKDFLREHNVDLNSEDLKTIFGDIFEKIDFRKEDKPAHSIGICDESSSPFSVHIQTAEELQRENEKIDNMMELLSLKDKEAGEKTVEKRQAKPGPLGERGIGFEDLEDYMKEEAEEVDKPEWKQRKFRMYTDEMYDIFTKKNSDYTANNRIGSAFDFTYDVLGPLAPAVRFLDKICRYVSLTSGKEQKVNDESVSDTLTDLANYALLTRLKIDGDKLRKKKENQ